MTYLRASLLASSILALSSLKAEPPEKILGIGAATIDLLITVDDQFMNRHLAVKKGGSNPFKPDAIEHILQQSHSFPKIVPGGSAANTVRALAKLGEKCAFYTHIGADNYGDQFSQNMHSHGIEQRFKRAPHYFTSHVLCLITPDSQRTFLGFDQEVTDCSPTKEDFKDIKWVHIEARQLKNGVCVEKILQLCKEGGAKISLDLSSFELVREFKETLLHLIPHYVEIVFCNEDEIRALTGLSPEEGCLALQKLCPIVVVTRGPQGCLVGHQNTLLSIPTFPATPLDTTGAGDLFASGFLYGYLKGYSLFTCALIGNRLGSAVVEVIGAELPEEHWAMIHNFLRESGL